jgi:hypothetical protein
MTVADTANGRPISLSETDPMDVVRIQEKEPATLEERVARVEARLSIIDTIANYATGVQAGDPEGVWGSFANEDLDYILGGTIDMRAKGRAEVTDKSPGKSRGYIRVADGKRTFRGFGDTNFRHMMMLPVIRISDDVQTAWVTMHFAGVITRFTTVHSDKTTHDGTYILTLRKYGDDWKIQKFVNLTELAHDPHYYTLEEQGA